MGNAPCVRSIILISRLKIKSTGHLIVYLSVTSFLVSLFVTKPIHLRDWVAVLDVHPGVIRNPLVQLLLNAARSLME